MLLRLDKYLSEAGYTRSNAKELIKKGLVKVNGQVVKDSSLKIESNSTVSVQDKEIIYEQYVYYMLNKPGGYVSATEDDKAPTVVSLIKDNVKNIFPIGRLDKDTEGLLILTNDGELSHNLLSPVKHVEKKYYVETDKSIDGSLKDVFKNGININNEYTTAPSELEIISDTSAFVTITEGKYHQVKRMFKSQGLNVIYLKRVSMKNLSLDENLSPGEYRRLTDDEVNDLKKV